MFLNSSRMRGKLLLKNCILADVKNLRIVPNTNVLVEDGFFRQVGNINEVPDAQVINLNGKTLTPGLIDAHVHLCLPGLPNCVQIFLSQTEEQRLKALKKNLSHTIKAGVTTVRDLGSQIEMLRNLRGLEQDSECYPSVVASGPVLTTVGGHAAFIGLITDGVNCAEQIQLAISEGADVIKLIGSGGYATPSTNPRKCQYSDVDFSKIINEATRLGLNVACHAHSTAAIDQCLRFGVYSIEHGTDMIPEQLPEFINTKTYWVPTFHICVPGEPYGIPVAKMRQNIRSAIEMGVKIAVGTDAGLDLAPHGTTLAHEMNELMSAGMTSLQVLYAATLQNAIMMGIENRKGSVNSDKDADFLIYDEDMTTPGFTFHNPSAVYKGGELIISTLSGGG